jgi:hypothetical protein
VVTLEGCCKQSHSTGESLTPAFFSTGEEKPEVCVSKIALIHTTPPNT